MNELACPLSYLFLDNFRGILAWPLRPTLDFWDWVEKQNFSFESMSEIRHLKGENLEVWDFHGNLREASAAFNFRIWDKVLAGKIRGKFERLKKREE